LRREFIPIAPAAEYRAVNPADELATKLSPVYAQAVHYKIDTSLIPVIWISGKPYVQNNIAGQTFSHPEIFSKKPKDMRKAPEVEVFREQHTNVLWGVYPDRQSSQRQLKRLFSPTEKRIRTSSVLPGVDAVGWSPAHSQRVITKHRQEKKQQQLKNIVAVVTGAVCIGTLAYESVVSPDTPSIFTYANKILSQTKNPSSSISSATKSQFIQTQPSKPNSTTADPFSIVSYNIFINAPRDKTVAAVKGLMFGDTDKGIKKHEIVMIQEATHVQALGNVACEKASCTFDMFPAASATTREGTTNRILWDKTRFKQVGAKAIPAGSDPGHHRFITKVSLKDLKTGTIIDFINSHAPNAVESGGLPNHNSKSVKGFEEYMGDLVATTENSLNSETPTVETGDNNWDFRKDKCVTPFAPCQALDTILDNIWRHGNITGENARLGTQGSGNRIIDYGYLGSTKKATFKLLEMGVYTNRQLGTDNLKYGGGFVKSDHKAITFDVQYDTIDQSNKSVGIAGQETAIPHIIAESIGNFHEVNNDIIKPGTVYRSGKLEGATQADIDKIAANFKLIIDLRTMGTRADQPDPSISGVPDLNFPIKGVSSAHGYVTAFYKDKTGRMNFSAALKQLARARGPVLVHCTLGKDRTGVLTALLMAALGANNQQIMQEYLKSNDYDAKVDESWLDAYINAVEADYGTIQNFVSADNGLGLSAQTLAKLQQKYGK